MMGLKQSARPPAGQTGRNVLLRSQFEAFTRQLPLLYTILIVNSAAVSLTHLSCAPAWLARDVPLALCTLCALRMIVWIRRGASPAALSDADVARRLRTTIRLIVVFGVLFTAWGLLLFPYGGPYAKVHVAYYMSITVIGCIFCLMHMRRAALLLTVIVLVPFTLFFLFAHNGVLLAIDINALLVALAMVVVLLTYYRDFASLVGSQAALEKKQLELQALSDENFRLANSDSLTGLPNRRHFLAMLSERFTSGKLAPQRFAVGVLDLDGFKQINDLHGHSMGDRLLEEVGRRLQACADERITPARLGGDEFGLLVQALDAADALHRIGALVCEVLRQPYELPGATARISASLGFAVFPDAGLTPEQLFERADYALYHAKDHRRGSTTVFSQQHEHHIREIGQIEQALRQADLAQEMTLHFQPIVESVSQRVVAYEALARWHSPLLGSVAPSRFVGIAERSDLIHQLTAVLLGKALALMTHDYPHACVSFNLSARDIASPDAVRAIREIVRASGVDASRLTFEITETAVIKNFELAHAALAELRALGAQISLDDFGTGYSSLHCIHQLPLNSVKIDRSFIGRIERDSTAQGIVRSIVDLCRNLRVTCVVEGVENEAQVRVLRQLGCTMMQGFYFGHPAPEMAQAPSSDAAVPAPG
jgi:diguanylate cyclase (GGDEF)-like protein